MASARTRSGGRIVVAALAMIAALGPSCTTPATEVIVHVDTDAPVDRQMTVTATVRDALIVDSSGSIHTWTRYADGGTGIDAGTVLDAGAPIVFPASFGVVPAEGESENGVVVLILQAQLAPNNLGEAAQQFRTIARFAFTPGETTEIRLFLSVQCALSTTGCTSVPSTLCTNSIRCEEEGLTCGSGGSCVGTSISPGTDGSVSTQMDALAGGDVTCPETCSGGPNATGVCTAGVCTLRCNSEYADCDGNPANGCEVNLLGSTSNCGACDRACPLGQLCASGTCLVSCPTGTTICSSACVNTHTDPMNCGGCGRACPMVANGVATCVAGVCGGVCNGAFGDCNHSLADGCETSLTSGIMNCGACGMTCTAGPSSTAVCMAGACGLMCTAGHADCDHIPTNGCEVDLGAAPANCGSCGHACATEPNAAATCTAGTCSIMCNSGFGNCDAMTSNGCEINLETSALDCGACGHACPIPTHGSPTCAGGSCSMMCMPDYADCNGLASDGCEVDTQTTLADCGGCGMSCTPANATPLCMNGSCTYTMCAFGFADLDGVRSNGCECTIDTYPGTCPSAAPIGSIMVGGHTTVSGNDLAPGTSQWFTVSFAGGSAPHIAITTNPGGHQLEIDTGGCGGATLCAVGETATAVTSWDFNDSGGTTTQPDPVPSVVYFRVFSSSPATCMHYVVTISN